MSYGREFIEDHAFEAEKYQEQINNIYDGIWETKNGEKIHIRNMTSSHISNCLKMFSEDTGKGKALRYYLNSQLKH